MVRFSLNIRLAVYTLFGKNKIKFGEKVFCIPKNMHSRTPMYATILLTLHTGPKMIKAGKAKSFQHNKIT